MIIPHSFFPSWNSKGIFRMPYRFPFHALTRLKPTSASSSSLHHVDSNHTLGSIMSWNKYGITSRTLYLHFSSPTEFFSLSINKQTNKCGYLSFKVILVGKISGRIQTNVKLNYWEAWGRIFGFIKKLIFADICCWVNKMHQWNTKRNVLSL